jgi:uncharacterized protein (DUF608 family)
MDMAEVDFDPDSGAYRDCRVARLFPLGGIGAGGLGFNTDGRFEELRLTNNWMCGTRLHLRPRPP